MAARLLQNMAVSSAHFLNCRTATCSFSSWLLGRLQTMSLFPACRAPQLFARDPLPFLHRYPLPVLLPVASYKDKMVLKRRCKDCFFVRRRGRLYVICKTHPRHKQRKM